jgi:hypothetical protein
MAVKLYMEFYEKQWSTAKSIMYENNNGISAQHHIVIT